MEVSNKTIFLFITTICLYVYLADLFNKPSMHKVSLFIKILIYFTEWFILKQMLIDSMGNETNHTIVNLIIERSNTMAAFVSDSSVQILNSIPVSF